MVAESIIESSRRFLKTVNNKGIPVRFGVIYGSQVTGVADEWSDIDLIVISPAFDFSRTHNDWARLWDMASLTDSRIEPIPCGERQWQTDDSSSIIEIARRTGQKIPL